MDFFSANLHRLEGIASIFQLFSESLCFYQKYAIFAVRNFDKKRIKEYRS